MRASEIVKTTKRRYNKGKKTAKYNLSKFRIVRVKWLKNVSFLANLYCYNTFSYLTLRKVCDVVKHMYVLLCVPIIHIYIICYINEIGMWSCHDICL